VYELIQFFFCLTKIFHHFFSAVGFFLLMAFNVVYCFTESRLMIFSDKIISVYFWRHAGLGKSNINLVICIALYYGKNHY